MERKYIPLSAPSLKGNELKYVTHAIETEWVSTGGAYVNNFEEEVAKYVGAKRAVSCQNGTAGIHTALMVAGVQQNHAVIVPTLTFIAAVNPVAYVGAEPLFMDCDNSLTMDPIKLEKFCRLSCDFVDGQLIYKKNGKHIKALIIVHVFGNMADMVKLVEIGKRYNLLIIEDATEAIGTYYTEGIYAGKYAGTIGDIGIYSFNGNKIITTGGGGMIVSKNDKYLDHAQHLTTQAKADALYYIHDQVGYNYRMTNLQAALGIAQLEQLESFIEHKKQNYIKYKTAFKEIPYLSIMDYRQGTRPNYWFYALLISSEFSLNRNDFISEMQERKVQTRPIWGLIHEQKPYLKNDAYEVEHACYYLERIVNLPCSSNLTTEEIDYIIDQIQIMAK